MKIKAFMSKNETVDNIKFNYGEPISVIAELSDGRIGIYNLTITKKRNGGIPGFPDYTSYSIMMECKSSVKDPIVPKEGEKIFTLTIPITIPHFSVSYNNAEEISQVFNGFNFAQSEIEIDPHYIYTDGIPSAVYVGFMLNPKVHEHSRIYLMTTDTGVISWISEKFSSNWIKIKYGDLTQISTFTASPIPVEYLPHTPKDFANDPSFAMNEVLPYLNEHPLVGYEKPIAIPVVIYVVDIRGEDNKKGIYVLTK